MPERHDRLLAPGGSPFGPVMAGAMERLVDQAVDPDTHNLHAGAGERCMICDRVIGRGRWVRRTISGGYVHDNC